jgi:hypothetical protein
VVMSLLIKYLRNEKSNTLEALPAMRW